MVDKEVNMNENVADESRQENIQSEVLDESFKKPTFLVGLKRNKAKQSSQEKSEQQVEEPKSETNEATTESKTEASNDNSNTQKEKQALPVPYREPSWSGKPEGPYKMEVLKSGVILETIDVTEKAFHVIGRLPNCDITLAHPTISRYHAVLQYRAVGDSTNEKGLYVYDLGSTHGTFWNGNLIRPNVYVRVRGGHMIRFGCSQRKFILQAPPEDEEEESDLTVTQLKEKRRLELEEKERQKKLQEEAEKLQKEREENQGINWGMGEDADEETDLAENPYALTNNEELFLDDPKKTLRGWFEREGHDLQYQTEEKGVGQFLCWVMLPLEDTVGRSVRAEALVKGKKKESVIQCALEACRILDRHGLLRQANHEGRKRKQRNWEEEDYYDSDEDNFLDRTGSIEKKRERRMKNAGKLENKVETYSSLVAQHADVVKKIKDIESRISISQKSKAANNEDDLDAFMSNLNSTVFNKSELTNLKIELQNLRKEEDKLIKLVNIAKPAELPALVKSQSQDVKETSGVSNFQKKYGLIITSNQKKSNAVSTSDVFSKDDVEKKPSSIDKLKTVNESESTEETFGNKSIDESIREKDDDRVNTPEITSPLLETASSSVKLSEEEDTSGSTSKPNSEEKTKINTNRNRKKAAKAKVENLQAYDTYGDNYSTWVPPQNQSGDGKTSLNEKYGY